MTTDSGQARYATGSPQESVDETQSSAQPSSPTLRAGSEQAPTRASNTAPDSLIGDPSGYATRWESIQVGFVDDPRSAVQEAETLVSDVMREMTAVFHRQRQQLEEQWSGGNQASTEDLRVAFQRYRDFFQRLLQV